MVEQKNLKKTGGKVMVGGKERVVYEGPRGGRYVKKGGEFVRVGKEMGGGGGVFSKTPAPVSTGMSLSSMKAIKIYIDKLTAIESFCNKKETGEIILLKITNISTPPPNHFIFLQDIDDTSKELLLKNINNPDYITALNVWNKKTQVQVQQLVLRTSSKYTPNAEIDKPYVYITAMYGGKQSRVKLVISQETEIFIDDTNNIMIINNPVYFPPEVVDTAPPSSTPKVTAR